MFDIFARYIHNEMTPTFSSEKYSICLIKIPERETDVKRLMANSRIMTLKIKIHTFH